MIPGLPKQLFPCFFRRLENDGSESRQRLFLFRMRLWRTDGRSGLKPAQKRRKIIPEVPRHKNNKEQNCPSLPADGNASQPSGRPSSAVFNICTLFTILPTHDRLG